MSKVIVAFRIRTRFFSAAPSTWDYYVRRGRWTVYVNFEFKSKKAAVKDYQKKKKQIIRALVACGPLKYPGMHIVRS